VWMGPANELGSHLGGIGPAHIPFGFYCENWWRGKFPHVFGTRRHQCHRPLAHFQRAMMMDVDQAAKAVKDAEIEAEIEDFLDGFNQPTYRGMRINGVRVPVRSSKHGWSGM